MIFSGLRKNLFFKNRTIVISLGTAIALNLAALIGLYFSITPRVELVALRYTIYFGIDLIGSWWQIFIFPLIGAIINVVNFSLAYLVFLRVKLIAYFLALTAMMVQIVLLIMSILIILLNI